MTKNEPLTFTAMSSSKTSSEVVSTVPVLADPGVVDQDVELIAPPPLGQFGVERLEELARSRPRSQHRPGGQRLPRLPLRSLARRRPRLRRSSENSTTTNAPSLARRMAMARPIPRLAPVTTAIFFMSWSPCRVGVSVRQGIVRSGGDAGKGTSPACLLRFCRNN